MAEKLYRPILNDGDHLVKSKESKGRVRGVSQDANNRTTDIVEWEEVEVAEQSHSREDDAYDFRHTELTPEQQQYAEMVGTAIAAGILYGIEKLHEHVIQPWWQNHARPWINSRMSDVRQTLFQKANTANRKRPAASNPAAMLIDAQANDPIDVMIDQAFYSIQFDMSTEEARQHIMNLIYHMLRVTHEIKFLSNARIADAFEAEHIKLENQAKAERLLAEKVAAKMNALLSDEKMQLDAATSKQLLSLLGGGIKIDTEYVPIEAEKIELAMNSRKEDAGFINAL